MNHTGTPREGIFGEFVGNDPHISARWLEWYSTPVRHICRQTVIADRAVFMTESNCADV